VTACADCRELLGAYVLGGLGPDEAAVLEQHLETCPRCGREYAELASLPELLDLAGSADSEPEAPPAALEEAVLDRFARESDTARPRPRKRRRLPRLRIAWTRPKVAFVSAVLAAAVAVGAMSALDRGDDQQGPAKNFIVALKPGPGAPHAKAHISLYRVGNGTGVHLWASGLQPGSMKVYEMLCESKNWSASAGTFRANAHGRVSVRLTTAARVGEYDRVRVVTRDRDGTKTDVLTGRLF
jgi:anti-sigma factor RsiW